MALPTADQQLQPYLQYVSSAYQAAKRSIPHTLLFSHKMRCSSSPFFYFSQNVAVFTIIFNIAFLFFSFKRSNPLDQLPSCLMQCFILKLQSGILLFIIIKTLLKCGCLLSPVLFFLLMIYHLSSSLSAALPIMSILVSCHFMETLWLHHTPYMVFFHANFLAYFDFYITVHR